jgi:hypothetical protein
MAQRWRPVFMLVAGLLAVSCETQSYTEREPGIPLLLDVDTFVSYSSEQSVRAALAPTPITDLDRSENDETLQPPYTLARLGVASFEHLGMTGELNLVFFNDRLESVWFFPEDVTAYTSTLKRRGVTIVDNLEDAHGGLLYVTINQNPEGRQYVNWSDRRLVKQAVRWMMRYAW